MNDDTYIAKVEARRKGIHAGIQPKYVVYEDRARTRSGIRWSLESTER